LTKINNFFEHIFNSKKKFENEMKLTFEKKLILLTGVVITSLYFITIKKRRIKYPTSIGLISDLSVSLLSLTKACGLSFSSAFANKPTVCKDESTNPIASKPIFGPKSDLYFPI
jgi:hypothetical protein